MNHHYKWEFGFFKNIKITNVTRSVSKKSFFFFLLSFCFQQVLLLYLKWYQSFFKVFEVFLFFWLHNKNLDFARVVSILVIVLENKNKKHILLFILKMVYSLLWVVLWFLVFPKSNNDFLYPYHGCICRKTVSGNKNENFVFFIFSKFWNLHVKQKTFFQFCVSSTNSPLIYLIFELWK